jgi:hypothetical protein
MVCAASAISSALHADQRVLVCRDHGEADSRRGISQRGEPGESIREYLDHYNEEPKPFVWTADADLILGKIQRLCE